MRAAFLLLLAGLLMLSSVALAAPELTIITEEYPPYNYTQDGKLTGVTTQLVEEIMRRQGLVTPVQVMPWARGYRRLQTEANVVLFTTARTAEREELFHWVGPLYVIRVSFYARKGSGITLANMGDAKHVKAIATYKDDFREQMLTSLGFTNLDSSNSPLSGLRKLMSGRVDLWFFDNIGTPKIAREAGLDPDALEELLVVQETHSYVAISKKTPLSVVKSWQATLDGMKADGSFWWIGRKWLPPDALMLTAGQDVGQQKSPLTIYTENAPPSTFEEKGILKGLSAELVEEILGRLGQTDNIQMVPWARGYQAALSEANVALFATTRLPQREALFHWVGPLYRQTWGFYGRKGTKLTITSLEEAKQVARIGTYRRDAKMQFLKGQGFTNLVPTNRNLTNVQHLMRGDIDLWVSSNFNVQHLVQQAGVDPKEVVLVYPFHQVGNYIAFSRHTSPHRVRLWQSVLEEMKTDGAYRRICLPYGYQPK